jgi:carbon storage regulator
MLVLTRKKDETIIIDGDIKIKVLEVRGKSVRIGIEAPKEIKIVREELVQKQLR